MIPDEGQILTGPQFSEPVRVETARTDGPGSWVLGVVGTKMERLRQSFLNGILTRLIDPDPLLRTRIAEYVTKGLASGAETGGKYRRVWFCEDIGAAEIACEADVYLLTSAVAAAPKAPVVSPVPVPEPTPPQPSIPPEEPVRPTEPPTSERPALISVTGSIPAEQWNRLGTRLIPKMRAAGTLTAVVTLKAEVDATRAAALSIDLKQITEELGLSASLRIDISSAGKVSAGGDP